MSHLFLEPSSILTMDMQAQLLRLVTDGLPHFISYIDTQQCYLFVNRVYEQWSDKTQKELIGQHLRDVIGEVAYEERLPYLETALAGRIAQFEARLPEKAGQRGYMAAQYIPDINEQGEVRGVIILLSDITEQKQREQALRESEGRLHIALQGTLVTVYQQDRELRYTWMHNPMDVYTLEEIIGKTDAELLPSDEAAYLTELKQSVLESGIAIQQEIKATGKAGTHYFDLRIEPLRNEHGNIIGVTGASIDVTERRELENRKDEFIGIASHELKTPLTTLTISTQMLRMQSERQGLTEQCYLLTKIEQQTNRLNKLVSDLLDMSKIQANKLEYAVDTIDVDAFLNDITEIAQHMSITHTIHLHGETQKQIIGDSDRLQQVILKLISNAIKYSPQSTDVDIFLSTIQDHVVISVRDYGIGISQEHHSKLFDRFYRAPSAEQKAFPGLGMGLYIANEIVRRHAGTITLTSEEGQGATFIVSLPIIKNK